MTTPAAESGFYLVVALVVALLPSIIALGRGLRDNHMGGIFMLNLMAAAGSFGSSFLGLAALATLPAIGLAFFALMVWAFVAPGRVQDREATARHHELLAALKTQTAQVDLLKATPPNHVTADWRVDAGLVR